MSLNVLTDTPSITPVRDPVWYELLCNGFRTTAAVPAQFTIGLLQQPAEGDTFTLAWLTYSITFTFVTGAVDESGTQVRLGTNVTATLANLHAALQGNYYVDSHFAITPGETEHTAIARIPGAMAVSLTNTAPPSIALVQTQPGVDAVFATNYTAVHQIWLETGRNTGVYYPLPQRDGRPDEHLRTRWPVNEMLHHAVKPQWPDYAQQPPSYLHQLTRRYYITRWELYGDVPTPGLVRRSAIKTAWYAGSRNSEQRQMQEVFAVITTTAQPTPFLTYRGRAGRHEVSPAQQSYLGWYRNVPKVAGQQLSVRATVHYTDGSNTAATIHTDTNSSDWQLGDVILIPTGFERQGLHLLQPTKDPTHYTVQVLGHTGAALSELYTYHLRLPDANELHLEWCNSLGVVESTRCVGSWVRGLRTEYDLVDRLVTAVAGQQPNPQRTQRVHHLRGVDNTIQFSTGFMDKDELDATLDLLFSPSLFILDHDRSTREPFIPTAGEYVQGQRGTPEENLYACNLSGLITHAEMARSLRTSMPALPPTEPGGPELETE